MLVKANLSMRCEDIYGFWLVADLTAMMIVFRSLSWRNIPLVAIPFPLAILFDDRGLQ